MQFEVRALAPNNQVATLVIDSTDEADARRQASARRLQPLSVKPTRNWARPHRGRGFSVVLFSQELLALLEAGLSIVESLEAMQEKSGGGLSSTVAAKLAGALRQGQRFSQALAALPEYFPPLFVGMVQAAETTSDIPAALGRFVDFESRLAAARSRAVSAAIYPAILLVVGGGVTLFLLGYVVPRFATVYEDAGRPMSWLTALLLQWGRFVSSHWEGLLAALLSLVVGGMAAWRVLAQHYTLADLLLRVPGVREQAKAFEMARLYLTAGMLLSGGMTLVRALNMAATTVSATTRAALRRCVSRVAAGETFSGAMAAEGLAGPVALRLFRVGEEAGSLGAMLVKAARFHDMEVTRFIDRFTRAAEPILMAAIGIVVGTIVVLLYMPIFELAGSLQ